MLSIPDAARTLSLVVIKPTMHDWSRVSSHQDRPMPKKSQLLAATAALLFTLPAPAADSPPASPPLPRLAGVNNGGPHNYDEPAYQKQLARLNFSVISYWIGWSKTYGMPM